MKTSVAISQSIYLGDNRLDASFHTSSGIQAKIQLKQWSRRSKKVTERLSTVADLFNGPRFPRFYVEEIKRGIPFLSSSDMLQADLTDVKRLSLKRTPKSLLQSIEIKQGWTLISCSGTIGNCVYVRHDMDEMTGSQHIMRAVPKSHIPSGYLFTFLSSAIGYNLLTQGTFGAVIQHIEPYHIKDIPIPRLDSAVEEHIHDLVKQAAIIRVKATALLKQSQERFYREVLGFEITRLKWMAGHVDAFAIGEAKFKATNHRLDAFHYVGYTGEADAYLQNTQPMGDLVEPYQPPLFKRPYTNENGIPFLSGIDLYDVYPKPHMYISRKMEGLETYRVTAGTILVQRVGQRYGLFGRPTILLKHMDGAAVTEHLFRLYPKDKLDRGFVYIWLSTEVGRRLLLKQSFGTSMGVLGNESFRVMPIPLCSSDLRRSFEVDVQSICEMREKAIELEDQAQMVLSKALQT